MIAISLHRRFRDFRGFDSENRVRAQADRRAGT